MHPVSAHCKVRIVISFMAQYGPRHACVLVGQGHRCHVRMSPCRDLCDPATERIIFMFRCSHHRPCTVDHQRSQVNITAFTDAEQAMLVTRAMLPRGDADASSHLPTLAILPGISHRGHHGRRGHRTDAPRSFCNRTQSSLSLASRLMVLSISHMRSSSANRSSHRPCSRERK